MKVELHFGRFIIPDISSLYCIYNLQISLVLHGAKGATWYYQVIKKGQHMSNCL